mgnify:FL=1
MLVALTNMTLQITLGTNDLAISKFSAEKNITAGFDDILKIKEPVI